MNPPESLWREIQLWRLDFAAYFFDLRYSISIVLIVLIWFLTGYFAGLLEEMSLEEALISHEIAVMTPVKRTPVRERLLSAIFSVGFFMLILTALMRVNLRLILQGGNFGSFTKDPLPYLAAGAWSLLLYFLLGLGLLSLSQFARLNARWRLQRIEINPKLARNWASYSIGFLLFIAIAASVLPTNYSLGLLTVIRYVLMLLVGVVIYFFGILWSLLVFLINLLAGLLGMQVEQRDVLPTMDNVLPVIPEQPPTQNTYPWLEFIKSLIFWLVFLTVIGFSLYHFVNQHESFLNSIREIRIISWFTNAFSWFRNMFKSINKKASIMLESSLARIRKKKSPINLEEISTIFRYRRLDARQRVFFTFFSMLRRGGERGLPRSGDQTPYEYAVELENAIPEVDQEIEKVTSAFVEARYSRSHITDEFAGIVRKYWSRIRSVLRKLKK
jgi:hypothetical protein